MLCVVFIIVSNIVINLHNFVFFESRSHHRHFPIIKTDNEEVQQVKQVKLLGIIVDEHPN